MGVECKDLWIPALQYADDMVLHAEGRIIRCVKEGGEETGSMASLINGQSECIVIGKCGIVHFRKTRMKRTEEELRVKEERIDVIADSEFT